MMSLPVALRTTTVSIQSSVRQTIKTGIVGLAVTEIVATVGTSGAALTAAVTVAIAETVTAAATVEEKSRKGRIVKKVGAKREKKRSVDSVKQMRTDGRRRSRESNAEIRSSSRLTLMRLRRRPSKKPRQ